MTYENENYEDPFFALRENCRRVSLEITEASNRTGEQRTREYQRLLNEILKLKEQDPQDEVFELHSLLGLLLLRTDKQKSAISELQLALQLANDPTPDNPYNNDIAGVWYNMGIAYMEINLFDEAFKCFQESVKIRPHNIKCYTSMAVVRQMQGNFKESYDILCDVLKTQKPQASDIEKVFISLGYTLYRSHNIKEAIECTDKILQQVNPQSEKALKLKGTLCQATGNIEDAWACCDTIFSMNPRSTEGHLLAGNLAQMERDYRRAFMHYNLARKIGRSYSFTLYNSIATVLSKLQKFPMALNVYRYILSIDQNPTHRNSVNKSINFFEAMAARKATEQAVQKLSLKDDERVHLPAWGFYAEGNKALDEGDVIAAQEALEKASAAEGAGEIWEIENAFGRIQHKLHNFSQAISYFERAAKKSDDNVSVLHNLASSFARNNEHERALEILDKLLKIHPDSQHAKKMRAVILGKLGKYDDSAEALSDILEKEPKDSYSLISMGRVWQEKGDFVKAHECFVQLLAKEPESEQAVVSIAINYSRAGNLRQAVSFVQNYLKRNPLSFTLNLTLANIFRFHKKFSDAEQYYRKCNVATYNREVYDGLADCICQMRRLDESLVFYEKIAENEKDSAYSLAALKSIAFIYRLKQDYIKSIEVYGQINWDKEYFFATWRNVALCYAGLSQKQIPRRGTSYFTKALKLYEDIKKHEVESPKHCARIDSLIAELYASKGEFAKACEIYKVAMQGVYYFITWKTYTNCLVMQGLYSDAKEVCEFALNRFNEDAKTRWLPDDLIPYRDNLEKAVAGDLEVGADLQRIAAEKLRSGAESIGE